MNVRNFKDAVAQHAFCAWACGCVVLLGGVAGGLYFKARPILHAHSLTEILFSTSWAPQEGRFGMAAFVAGTILVTILATMVSGPVSLLSAIFLAEYATPRQRRLILPLVDLLSGIPSVIYGVWGILVVVPAVAWLSAKLGVHSTGYCLLSGALVLAIMVSPFIIHLSHEVLSAVPNGIREASLSLGATQWETVRKAVLRKALPGLVGAVVLGLARALGETIAVLMVVGNVPVIPRSLFDPAYPLPSLLANHYGEMMSTPLYDSALLLAALLLLGIVLFFNLLAKALLHRWEKEMV